MYYSTTTFRQCRYKVPSKIGRTYYHLLGTIPNAQTKGISCNQYLHNSRKYQTLLCSPELVTLTPAIFFHICAN